MFKDVLNLLETISDKYREYLHDINIHFLILDKIELKVILQYVCNDIFNYINLKINFIDDEYYELSINNDYSEYWKNYMALESDLINNIEMRLHNVY